MDLTEQLLIASENGQIAKVVVILERGANVNARDKVSSS